MNDQRPSRRSRPTFTDQEALQFHSQGRPGKLEVVPTKPMATQRDLSLAYSPGVAVPVKAIAENPSCAFDFTARANMVAVISNGTAILGLGNLGALASKPVMEGKAVLFKRFADVDSIDLEVDTEDPDAFINSVRYLGPSFGGINLEDIKAPECFIIEERLRELMDIPVFHDDQHGTAIIAAAGLINALHLTGRDMAKTRLVVNGAGAAGIACTELLKAMGFAPNNVILCDTKGVVYRGRTEGMNQWKSAHAAETDARTLAEALDGGGRRLRPLREGRLHGRHDPLDGRQAHHLRDGESRPGDHARGGGPRPRRRDHRDRTFGLSEPGQQRARLPVHLPRGAGRAGDHDQHGDEDRGRAGPRRPRPRGRAGRGGGRLSGLAPALRARLHHPGPVRSAPHRDGAARGRQGRDGHGRRPPSDRRHAQLQGTLSARLDPVAGTLNRIFERVRKFPKRVVFAEGEEEQVIRAALSFVNQGLGTAILVGREERVHETATFAGIDLEGREGIEIHNARLSRRNAVYAQFLYERLQRQGFLFRDCQRLINQDRNHFAASMVALGDADAMVTGVTRNYSTALTDVQRVIDAKPGHRVIGVSLCLARGRTVLVADTAIHEMPNARELAEIAIEAAGVARRLGYEPRVALLSFSTFGHPKAERAEKIQEAVRILDGMRVDFEYDGEMAADIALNREHMAQYPFSRLKGPANVLVMPAFHSASISTKMLQELGGAMVLGPLVVGLDKPVQIVSLGSTDADIVNMAALAGFNIGG